MADSSGNTDGILVATSSVRNLPVIRLPWPLIVACIVVVLTIAASMLYIFVHLLDQDKILLKIDRNLCTVAVHDAQVDRKLAAEAHSKIMIEVPISCRKLNI